MVQVSILIFALCYSAINAISIDYPRNDVQEYIVGGSEAQLGQFPHMISMRNSVNMHVCGGAIISDRWIVSAAHCMHGRNIGNTFIVVGTINSFRGGTPHNVAQIISHPAYNPMFRHNDVAIIQTTNKMTFTDTVKAIPIGSDYLDAGVDVQISGWGRVDVTANITEILMFINSTTITNIDCQSRIPLLAASAVMENSVCTMSTFGQGICYGDSGSPLIANGQVVGVVAWTIPCGVGGPDVYARLSPFREWIYNLMGLA